VSLIIENTDTGRAADDIVYVKMAGSRNEVLNRGAGIIVGGDILYVTSTRKPYHQPRLAL
jgi:hypothetical protein